MSDPKSPDELAEIFAAAARIAERVPEGLRPIAFQRALDQLLGAPTGPKNPGKPEPDLSGARTETGAGEVREEDRADRLVELLDRTEYADVMASARVLEKALFVLRAAHHHGIEQLTPSEIARVLTEKFRERTSDAAVRMALGSDSSYTDRQREGKGFAYKLMAAGERYLANRDAAGSAGLEAKPPKPGTPRAGRTSRGTAKRASNGKAKASRQSTGRPGPKRMIEDLIAQGFFDQPRDIGAIIAHVQQKRGYRYKATDLSPALARLLREQRLDRERDDKSQYQYRRHA